ncbi:hypothetical protein [Streptomyces sp. NPDC056291]|uniref:hypothetical protein n=1 Tax=Streptomyces sp. NPDC056291 TaxID=3345772 RepID=UPI0035D56EAB
MDPRLRRFGNGLMTCLAVAWFGHQTLYGEGLLRIVSALMLVMSVIAAAGLALNDIRPRPKRRRSRERDAG